MSLTHYFDHFLIHDEPQAAAILAAGLRDWVDLGVICALLLLNASVGFIQEFQAGSIVDELKKTLALKSVVCRDGDEKEIDALELVPGDIVKLEEVIPLPQFPTRTLVFDC